MLREIRLSALIFACYATFAGPTSFTLVALHAQDVEVRDLLKGVDLTGVQDFRLSPNEEFVAGLTRLSPIPGPRSGSFSLIRIWTIQKKELVHEFRIPGKAYEAVFSPDSSTLVVADRTGNLGFLTTIRAWDLAEGTMRKVGECGNQTGKLHFSPDGGRIAAVQQPDYFFNSEDLNFQLNVWPIGSRAKSLSIAIPNPLGEARAVCPPIDEWSKERQEEVFGRVVPQLLGFSSDGKVLICETKSGLRTTYDSQSGKMLKHANVSSVGLFKSMLMIALDEVPDDVRLLTLEITPLKRSIQIQRADDNWWRTGTHAGFKIDGKYFVSQRGKVETREHIAMRFGLNDDTNFAELVSLRHPLGAIQIERSAAGIRFRLEEARDGDAKSATMHSGEVRWAPEGTKESTE